MMKLVEYGDVRLMDIKAEQFDNWNAEGATHMRVILPSSADNALEMQKQGFVFVDRTLGVSVNLGRSKLDFSSMVRMEVVESRDYKDDVLRIAKDSFTEDYRFNILPQSDNDLTLRGIVLESWISKADSYLVCMYKDVPIGFLMLVKTGEDSQFVHLAAVEKRYRATGAGLSLYAKAAALCKTKGYKKLEGRISSRNIAVMNLYAYLGGSFALPEDVYLKEVELR